MFRKILAANSITKAAQIFYNYLAILKTALLDVKNLAQLLPEYLGYFEKHHFKVELAVATEYAIQAFCHVF